MMREILKEQGIKTGLVGTIAIYSGDIKLKDSDRTTPESLELQRMFARMVEDGCRSSYNGSILLQSFKTL